ncbi:lipid A deacylase LpxR family protein [Moritella sp. 24]|uniref:lipid A deacylase LpxR family protein n=1 Tax=Moritella sp. 24 TaxID=2746230 RepID=UPI0021036F8A|nr:lipid A deacylase LpxR family protein [Moritella sp. 24]
MTRTLSIPFKLFSIILLALSHTNSSFASGWLFGMHNDAISDEDGNYTNAVFINYTSEAPALNNPFWQTLTAFDPNPLRYAVNYQFGQQMWTPSDISIATPQPDERPYAGLLFGEASVLGYSKVSSYRLSLLVGAVGEQSKAGDTQTLLHELIGATTPEGWDNQIEDDIVYQVTAEADQLIARPAMLIGESDLSIYQRVAAGNYQSEVAFGSTVRWGVDLGANYNNLSLHPYRLQGMLLAPNSSGIMLYATAEIRYRFNDITIEGDTPETVPDITLNNVQATAAAGLLAYYQNVGIKFSVVAMSPDYEEDSHEEYIVGSLGLFWQF